MNNVSELIRKEYTGSTVLAKGNTEQFIQVGTYTKFKDIFGIATIAINGNLYYELSCLDDWRSYVRSWHYKNR